MRKREPPRCKLSLHRDCSCAAEKKKRAILFPSPLCCESILAPSENHSRIIRRADFSRERNRKRKRAHFSLYNSLHDCAAAPIVIVRSYMMTFLLMDGPTSGSTSNVKFGNFRTNKLSKNSLSTPTKSLRRSRRDFIVTLVVQSPRGMLSNSEWRRIRTKTKIEKTKRRIEPRR